MSRDARPQSPADPEPVIIEPGREADLPAITAILNHAIANSNATLATEPVTIDDRQEWFARFSLTGPYRLLASVALHRKLGFTEVGTFHEYAIKNGQYLSSLWMERHFQHRQPP